MRRHWKNTDILFVVALMLTAASCRKGDDTPGTDAPDAISFSTELTGEAVTRAAYPLYYYHKNFMLKGVKTVNSVTSDVFTNYWVEYLDKSSKTWEYITGEQTTVSGQIEKYWDTSASEYRFIAGAPYDHTAITDINTLTISGLKGAMASSSTIETGYLFSEPQKVSSTDFGKKVTLTFNLALCRIKLQFYFDNEQSDDVAMTDITFGPINGGTYAKTADMTVSYDWSGMTHTHAVTPGTSGSGALSYSNMSMAAPCTAKTEAMEIYYMIPHSSVAEASDWLLTIGSFTEHNTATVPASYMKWEPGHQYVYIFKLSGAKVDPTIKFVSCVKSAITGWTDAESTDTDLYNW